MFDLICGTSTGGEISVLLGIMQCTSSHIYQIYQSLSARVFSRNAVSRLSGWLQDSAQYSTGKLEMFYQQILGQRHFYNTMYSDGPKVHFCMGLCFVYFYRSFLFAHFSL